jgi:tetratricopeptide (TPR) repeat protein/ubiquinone/menaquinone biosynthesis C-methylase UbiE
MNNAPFALNQNAQAPKYFLDDQSKKELLKAEEYKNQGKWAQAEKKTAKVLKKYPDCGPGLMLLSIVQIKQKKLKQALMTANKILEIDENDKQALKNRTLIAVELRDDKLIDDYVTAAIEKCPEDAKLNEIMGQYLQHKGNLVEALPYYKKAIELDPELKVAAGALLNLAGALYHYKDFNAALELWILYLQKNPKDDRIMAYVADTLFYLGKADEAMEMSVQALAHNPDSPRNQAAFIHTLRGVTLNGFNEKIFQALFYCLSLGKMDFLSVYRPWHTLFMKNPELSKCTRLIKQGGDINKALDNPELTPLLTHPFLTLSLQHMIHSNPEMEMFMTGLRRVLLQRLDAQKNDDIYLPLTCALAENCFFNEYVWSVSAEELAILDKLKVEIESGKAAQQTDKIILLASYMPLYKLENAQEISKILHGSGDDKLKALAKLQIDEPLEELELRSSIRSLSDIEDDVSQKVRAQYEENPYPRWRNNFVQEVDEFTVSKEQKEILVAGCGTGRHISIVAMRYPNAKITGLDLSLTSLSYAQRKINELNLPNIELVHGDILEVEKLGKTFDHIESSGVLHHMDDPFKGWQALTNILKSGGTMKIGLYSEIARQHIVKMRDIIKKEGFKDDIEGIRAARQYVFDHQDDALLKDLLISRDFYTTSNCRDLIMHVQEHRYTIPQIKEEIEKLGLAFESMCHVSSRGLILYKQMFANDPSFQNLTQLEQFEKLHPRTFAGMYNFDLKKPEK